MVWTSQKGFLDSPLDGNHWHSLDPLLSKWFYPRSCFSLVALNCCPVAQGLSSSYRERGEKAKLSEKGEVRKQEGTHEYEHGGPGSQLKVTAASLAVTVVTR